MYNDKERPEECSDFKEHCEPTVKVFSGLKLIGYYCKRCFKFFHHVEEDKGGL